jgi:FAD/FMN-containing dehydrogenase
MLQSLRDAFSGRLLTEPSQTAGFLTDWRGRLTGRALAVAQPDRAEDVARIVAWCAEHRVPIVAQGGNTGLVGASVPDESGQALVLSLKRLNRIRAVDPMNNTITAEAGCVLADVQAAAREANRLFPLSLAAEGSCTLGGNLSTNAGGVQVLRYGNTRELCLGLEVVTPQGELWQGLRGLRKDNTGYDLRDLFIGAEGSLGVITAATMKLHPLPAAQLTAFAAIADVRSALALLELAQTRLASSLTAFELISERCMGLVLKHFADCRRPIAQTSPYYVLLETSDAESLEHAQTSFGALLEQALERGIITDAVIAASMAQSRALWALRENISEAQAREGKNIKHDIAVPISEIDRFIQTTDAALEKAFEGIRMVVFGHLGDGNLHYNVSPPPGVDPNAFLLKEADVNAIVYDQVARFGGSISAEHGLGSMKVRENERRKSPVELALMHRIKQALDPMGLMNPGRVLSQT